MCFAFGRIFLYGKSSFVSDVLDAFKDEKKACCSTENVYDIHELTVTKVERSVLVRFLKKHWFKIFPLKSIVSR